MATILQKLNLQPFWRNPVVVRDMRVRLRGSRAFWNQAFYLGLLCLIALLGYGFSVGINANGNLDPVAAQSQLQGFYYTIFVTVAILISLIAPGLTAVSIIFERQRLTLDLLVTTPMTSMQMLVGKLVSSIAFVILLLVLSVPISALCVILGGATIGDVLQTYALLAIDGIVLASIGLAYSCSSKQNVQAIVGTYATIVIYFVVTFSSGISAMPRLMMGAAGAGAGSAPMPTIAAILYLNPIVTIYAPGHAINVLGLGVPPWLATGIAAFLLVRLILTGAALRLGMYGGGLIASLRRQVLLCTAIFVFFVAQSFLQLSRSFLSPGDAQSFELALCVGIFALSLFYLPALFVPVVDPDAPQGTVVTGRYDIRRAFSAPHSGALPFFHLWLIVMIASAVLGSWSGAGSALASPFGFVRPGAAATAVVTPHLLSALSGGGAAAFFYCSGVGFLLWSLSRRAAWLSASYTAARPMAFLFLVFVVGIPVMIMAILSQMNPDADVFSTSGLRFFWLGYPFQKLGDGAGTIHRFLASGALAYLYGVLAYPFWRSVTPGEGTDRKRRPVIAAPVPPPAASGVN